MTSQHTHRTVRPPRPLLLAAGVLALSAGGALSAAQPDLPAHPAAASPKNIIVFIADGCGESTHRAFEFWHGDTPVYQTADWSRYDVTTYALRSGARPVRGLPLLEQDERLVFDHDAAFDTTPIEGSSGKYPFHFAGYRWLRATAPDSANTATSIFTGVSTYKGAINVDGEGTPVLAASHDAKARGKAVGVVTSVPFSHATPACAADTHVVQREMYHEISHQLLTNGVCDVIAGAGHPDYDDSAHPRDTPKHKFISEDDWNALRAGTIGPSEDDAWTLVDDVPSIRDLAEGDTPPRLFMVGRAAQSLQQVRVPHTLGDATPPGEHPLNTGVPTLLDFTKAALNAVDDDPDGFFLVVEGGAVDWAMHDNQIGRMIEEMADYHDTVAWVCSLLDSGERGFDWSDTLVIVTADHDHLLLGPESDTTPFQPVQDRGRGSVPGHIWHSDSHSNLPVPLYVRGAGAERFSAIPTTREGSVQVFHQTEIGKVLRQLSAPGIEKTAAE